MRKYLLGFAAGIVVVLLVGFSYVRFGFVNSCADMPVNSMESMMAMPALDASVARRAPEVPNPVSPTDDNLVAGMKIYQANCATCHGDVHRPEAMLADALYPRAPQFVDDAPDMPENQNFYIIQHGVRLSGMPAWGQTLNAQQMWQVTTFLSHMDKLPPQVSDAWKTAAGGPAGSSSPAATPTMDMHGMNMGGKKMNMQ